MVAVRVAVFSLSGCEGCRYSLVEALLRLGDLGFELVHEPLLGVTDGEYDVAVVEGAVGSQEDLEKLREIRRRAKLLVALGSCAVLGGVPAMATPEPVRGPKTPIRAAPLSRYVKVDYWVRGCPPTLDELERLLKWIAEEALIVLGERGLEYCRERAVDVLGSLFRIDGEKCIVCGRCVKVCESMGVCAIDYANRSIDVAVTTPFQASFDESACIACGRCLLYCPVGALREVNRLGDLVQELRLGLLETAYVEPEALAGLCAALKAPPGRIAAALKELGFRRVVVWRPAYKPEPEKPLVPASYSEYLLIKKHYPDLIGLTVEPRLKLEKGAALVTACIARRLEARGLVVTAREVLRLLRSVDLEALPEEELEERLEEEPCRRAVGPSEVGKVLEKALQEGIDEPVVLYVCPGGCLSGGGQPYPEDASEEEKADALKAVLSLLKPLALH